MPRSIWKGSISFGMVAIPIKLYPATNSKDIAFVTLHSSCHTRLRHRRWCPEHEEFVELADVVKGFEAAKGQYLVMAASDFGDLPVASRHTIEVTRFIDLADIDPVYYEKSYVLEPDKVGEKPYYLLKKALEASRRVAIAKVSLRQKELLCSLRPVNNGIVMSTMFWPDEIRSTDELNLPEAEVTISDQELAMANMLIDQLAGRFEPEQHRDEYRAALEKVIEAKMESREPDFAAPAPVKGKVSDLMEALRASIEAAKSASGARETEAAAEEGAAAQPSPEKAPARPG